MKRHAITILETVRQKANEQDTKTIDLIVCLARPWPPSPQRAFVINGMLTDLIQKHAARTTAHSTATLLEQARLQMVPPGTLLKTATYQSSIVMLNSLLKLRQRIPIQMDEMQFHLTNAFLHIVDYWLYSETLSEQSLNRLNETLVRIQNTALDTPFASDVTTIIRSFADITRTSDTFPGNN